MMTIVTTLVYSTRATEVIATHQSAYNEENNIGKQLINIRHWLNSLTNEWSSSESDTHGKITIVIKNKTQNPYLT